MSFGEVGLFLEGSDPTSLGAGVRTLREALDDVAECRGLITRWLSPQKQKGSRNVCKSTDSREGA